MARNLIVAPHKISATPLEEFEMRYKEVIVNAPNAIPSRTERARRILALNIEILTHTINFHNAYCAMYNFYGVSKLKQKRNV